MITLYQPQISLSRFQQARFSGKSATATASNTAEISASKVTHSAFSSKSKRRRAYKYILDRVEAMKTQKTNSVIHIISKEACRDAKTKTIKTEIAFESIQGNGHITIIEREPGTKEYQALGPIADFKFTTDPFSIPFGSTLEDDHFSTSITDRGKWRMEHAHSGLWEEAPQSSGYSSWTAPSSISMLCKKFFSRLFKWHK